MAGEDILKKHKKPTLGEYISSYFRQNSALMDRIKIGLADIKAGRIRSWEEVKRGFDENPN